MHRLPACLPPACMYGCVRMVSCVAPCCVVCVRARVCVALRSWKRKRCVSALHLDTLNKQRAMLLVQSFMGGRHEDMRPEWVSTKVIVVPCARLKPCFFTVGQR